MNSDKKTVLITGAAGFIGYHLVQYLEANIPSWQIIALDNLNSYYDVELKKSRISQFSDKIVFIKGSIADRSLIRTLLSEYNPQIIVNLAAQAGVRYSIDCPETYIESNVVGFFNLLDEIRLHNYSEKPHFIYASSSSVYGENPTEEYSENDVTDGPVSLYAASKKCDEVIAYAYSKLYGIPSTGLRFFTVYGPYGRPDMAYYKFTDMLKDGKKIQLYNYGKCYRDFTYVEDIVQGIVKIMLGTTTFNSNVMNFSQVPSRVYNIGNNTPVSLIDFIKILTEELIRAKILPENFKIDEHIELVEMQPGDVPYTCADVSALARDYGYSPQTDLRTGLRMFAEWYASYYKLPNH